MLLIVYDQHGGCLDHVSPQVDGFEYEEAVRESAKLEIAGTPIGCNPELRPSRSSASSTITHGPRPLWSVGRALLQSKADGDGMIAPVEYSEGISVLRGRPFLLEICHGLRCVGRYNCDRSALFFRDVDDPE